MKSICPGQDTRFWQLSDVFEVDCGGCGSSIEFFKNDTFRRCKKCGRRVANPKISIGCAQWCEHAKECLGYDPKEGPPDGEVRGTSVLDRLIEAMKKEFGEDYKRVAHALRVLEHAESILHDEEADAKVVLAAAVLHDIGIQEAERKHGSAAGKYQELEGPAIARRIMEELKMDADTIDHVCKIVGSHHSAKDIDTPEFRILWDCDWLVNIPVEHADLEKSELKKLVNKVFKTKAGKKLAFNLFIRDIKILSPEESEG